MKKTIRNTTSDHCCTAFENEKGTHASAICGLKVDIFAHRLPAAEIKVMA